MKRLVLLLLALLLAAPSALGQSVGASQIKKKANAGLVADGSNALAVAPYRGTTAPSAPVTGQLWLDTTTTPATLKTWTGAAWEIPPTGSAVTQADLSAFPASPTDGQIVWLRKEKRSIVYDATADEWYYLDGVGTRASTSYSLEAAGYPNDLLSPPTAPTLATGTGVSTAGSHVCAVTFFNSTGGETTPSPVSNAVTTTAGLGYSLTDVATGGTGTAGRRVYCSKAGTAAPLFLVGRIEDNTTTTFTYTGADATFGTHTAPDVNFSASIPSGWTVWLPPGTGYQYGGCGSTGESLMCMATGTLAASSSSSGVRLTYGITDESDYWRAQWKVIRAASGFPGNTSASSTELVAFMATSANDIAAPAITGITGLTNHLDASGAVRAMRPLGAAWASNAAAAAVATYRMVDFVPPRWVAYTQAGFNSHWYLSGNGKDWNTPYSYISNVNYVMRHVGISGEAKGGTASAAYGSLFEITDFTVESWP